MSTNITTALEELSELLGVEVVRVTRNPPAHERRELWVVNGQVVHRPAHEDTGGGGERPAREYWWLKVVDPSGAVFPLTGRHLTLRLESGEVRNGRAMTFRLRRLGSAASLDNRAARRVLRLMHEILEGESNGN